MDDTTRKIIDSITVTYPEAVSLGASHRARVVYHCEKLRSTDLARLAAQAVGHVPSDTFDLVVGIAYAGIFFAGAVAGGHENAILQIDGNLFGPSVSGKRVVIVDDVLVTGSRIMAAHQKLTTSGAKVVGAACIIDRSGAKPQLPQNLTLWSAYQTNME